MGAKTGASSIFCVSDLVATNRWGQQSDGSGPVEMNLARGCAQALTGYVGS